LVGPSGGNPWGLPSLSISGIAEQLIENGIITDILNPDIPANDLAESIIALEQFKTFLDYFGKGIAIVGLAADGYNFYTQTNLNTTIGFAGGFLGALPNLYAQEASWGILLGQHVLYPSLQYLTNSYYPGGYEGFLEDAYDVSIDINRHLALAMLVLSILYLRFMRGISIKRP
jgi:hypothetical protein